MGVFSSKPDLSEVNWLETPNFADSDNNKIFCKYWEPESSPRALLFMCHGLGEHCQWYDPLAKEYTEKGILVFSHDHVGHGLSEGRRCYIDTFSQFTESVLQHTRMMTEKYPNLPVFILGHSMGGLIAIKMVLDHPDIFKGMILIGPLINFSPETATPFKIRMAKVVARVSPAMPVGSVDSKWSCHDEEHVKKYDSDPLVYHGGIRAKMGVVLLETVLDSQKRLSEIKLPIYNVHGSDDILCEISGSRMLHEQASSTDKTLQVVDGGYHVIHFEPNGVKEKYTKEMVDWLVDRL